MGLYLLRGPIGCNHCVILILDLLPVSEGVIEVFKDLKRLEIFLFIIDYSLEACFFADLLDFILENQK